MIERKELIDWILKNNKHPRIDLREEEGSYLCDDDYEGNGHFFITTDDAVEYLNEILSTRNIQRY